MIGRWLWATLALGVFSPAVHAEPSPPQRIVSINLCADESLLAQAAAVNRRPPGERRSVVLYLRRGYVTGSDTLTSELLAVVGLDNAGSKLAGVTGGVVPLEKLIASPPDYLLVSSLAPPAEDQGSALLAHPALAALFPPERRIALPERLTVCGGPSLPAALDWLASEAQRVRR